MFLIFTDANNGFKFVNADKPCRKKTKSSEKAFNIKIFDKLIVVGSNLLTVKLLTNVNFGNFGNVFFDKAFSLNYAMFRRMSFLKSKLF